MSTDRASLKKMLGIQLQDHLQKRISDQAYTLETQVVAASDSSLDRTDCYDLASWLGRQPASTASLAACVQQMHTHVEAHSFSSGLAQLGGPSSTLQRILSAFGDKARTAQLEKLYDKVLAQLNKDGVDVCKLKILSMICAGGTPFRAYGAVFGMGDQPLFDDDVTVALHVQLAKQHGIIFDLIPLYFHDFNQNILAMGVGIGAVLLAKLQAREQGRMLCSGVVFGCKGTLSAALALSCYLSLSASPSPIAMVGMGTDLTQGFEDIDIKSLQQYAPCVIFNSLQDSAVGDVGKERLDGMLQKLTGHSCSSHHVEALVETTAVDIPFLAPGSHQAVWYDIEAFKDRLSLDSNPDHNWYDVAFAQPAAFLLKEDILTRIMNLIAL